MNDSTAAFSIVFAYRGSETTIVFDAIVVFQTLNDYVKKSKNILSPILKYLSKELNNAINC